MLSRLVLVWMAAGSALTAQAGPVPVASFAELTGRVTSGATPLPGATVELVGIAGSARAGSDGRFRLRGTMATRWTVRVRALGYAPAVHIVALDSVGPTQLNVSLTPSASVLNTVVTTGTLRATYVSESPIKVDVVTPAVLQRNVTNNLMDNVSFLPGLNQQVDCGVCFTNNIRVNGMEGPYTAVLIDGTPMVSALATVYGLNSIDPSLIEQLEIIKGPSSTLYGSEAMGGVINIVTRDARLAPKLSVNAFGTSNGESSLSLGGGRTIGNANTLLSINGAYNTRFVDNNGDGFRDLPSVKRLSVFNKWAIGSPANRPFEMMARYYTEDRLGGVKAWTTADRGSSTVYGESIRTNRAELLGTFRTGAPSAPIRFDLSLNWHHQDSYYGHQAYLATQTIAFGQAVWSPTVGAHALLLGATLRNQNYRDSTRAQQTRDSRFIPGVFVQDEVVLAPKVTLVGGMRLDHHALHGLIPSPRVALKYAANPHTTVRVNAATGFRVVSLFTEDHAALTGARQVQLAEKLNPERSGTITVGLNRVLDVGGIEDAMTVDVDAFYTRFSNRIVGNFDIDPNLILYQNLRGNAVTRGVSVALGYSTLRQPLFGNVGLTLQDVFIRADGVRRDIVFSPRVQGVFTLGYRFARSGLTIDWTGRVQGPTPLPKFDGLASVSPWFTEQHVQMTRQLRRGPALYVAVKNVFGYVQRDPIVDAANPFGDRFDTARVFGPLQGRRVLFGVRHMVGR